MKRTIITSILVLISMVGFSQAQQQEKVFTIQLTESQINAILNLINDAPLSGETRRAFDKLLRDQAIAQLQREQKSDSTSKQPVVKDKPKEKQK
jgi:hypothetical protein